MEPKLNIILADDETIVLKTIGNYLSDLGHHVDEVQDGASALELIAANDYDLGIIDIRMPKLDGLSLLANVNEICPEMSTVIITGHGNMDIAIQALRLGAADFLTKPVKFLELEAVLEKAVRLRALRQDKRHLKDTIKSIQAAGPLRSVNRTLVGTSAATHQVREQIRLAVEAGCETILVTGETGVGKEVVARKLHFQASSDASPFIAVSCPAIPDTLLESELFGHVKGAFTGASENKVGYFELANGGTLFLDEVADLSASAQASLLRVLETRTLRWVGGAKEISVKVRVIAATNAHLKELVEAGKFRRDLFYRLNVYCIHILPLRQRREDILPLAEYFLKTYAKAKNQQFWGFSKEARSLLLNYDFPGNARELRNLVEHAAILCRGGQILAEHLNLPAHTEDHVSPKSVQAGEDNERARIKKALEETKWNRRQAAKKLNLSYSTLRYKIEKLGIGLME